MTLILIIIPDLDTTKADTDTRGRRIASALVKARQNARSNNLGRFRQNGVAGTCGGMGCKSLQGSPS
jgi:hypothetical protein